MFAISEAPIDVAGELRSIDQALAVSPVPHDEWEVLYRQRLQVERDLLAGARPGASFPGGGPKTLAPDRNGRSVFDHHGMNEVWIHVSTDCIRMITW